MSGGYNLTGYLKGLKPNWYGTGSPDADEREAMHPPRPPSEYQAEAGERDASFLSDSSSSLDSSYVQLKALDVSSDAEMMSSSQEQPPPQRHLGGSAAAADPPCSVSHLIAEHPPAGATGVLVTATLPPQDQDEGPMMRKPTEEGARCCRDRAYSKVSEESHEDEDGPLDDGYVQIDSSMHVGHVDVKVIKQGWLKKQVFHVIDGRPDWRRHFARWKQRYFVLGSDACLRYYADEGMQRFRRCIHLAGMEVTRHFYASESTEESGRCFIIRPKQKPQARRRSLSQPRDQHEEEIKFLSSRPEEMEEWLGAIQGEIEASEEQGQTIFKAAWGSLKSLFLERQRQGGGGGGDTGGAAELQQQRQDEEDDVIDFVHIPPERAEDDLCIDSLQQPDKPRLSRDLSLSDLTFATPTVPIPRMSIVIMVVGTQGDVQPFVVLGKQLQKNGHRVRLATHELYRPLAAAAGLEFYPLAGDPKKLSAFMVKTSGRIFPKLYDHEEMTKDVPEQMAMLHDIIHSTWPACTAPDPANTHQHPPFIADAIISNPVTYGHIHCAEALSVPLHIMFPQPWSPTKAFPHPLSGLPYSGRWCKENYYSFIVVDKFVWFGIRDIINQFRLECLGLEPIRLGEHGGDLLNHNKVPFAKMWSPSLVPKPKDWGPNIDVVGNIFGDVDESSSSSSPHKEYTPSAELEAWLSSGPAPIFVGFGSMVIEDTQRLVQIIIEASLRTRTRVVLQSSWSTMMEDSTTGPLPNTIFRLGACPHDWLMPRMQAVIHHGGAGTVAAGLRAGKPTMVCPFFGDQFFWGYVVHQARVGVRPVPVTQLTTDKLAEAFQELKSPRLAQAAQAMSHAFARENGAKEAVKVFYRHLPLEDMVCDVSLFTSRPLVARRYCDTCGLKLSLEADAIIHDHDKANHETHDYFFVNWGVVGPQHAAEGLVQGITSATHEFLGAVTGMVTEPVVGAHKSGVAGAAKGVAKGLFNLVRRPIRGGIILVDKVSTGVSNSLLSNHHGGGGGGGGNGGGGGSSDGERTTSGSSDGAKPRRYMFYENLFDMRYRLYNHLAAATRGSTNDDDEDGGDDQEGSDVTVNRFKLARRRKKLVSSPLPESYAEELRAGYIHAQRCKELFLKITKGNPSFVTKDCVLSLAEKELGDVFYDQFLSRELLNRIDSVGDGRISFQQFCVFFKAWQELQSDEELRRGDPQSPHVAQALNSIIYDSVFLEDQHAGQEEGSTSSSTRDDDPRRLQQQHYHHVSILPPSLAAAADEAAEGTMGGGSLHQGGEEEVRNAVSDDDSSTSSSSPSSNPLLSSLPPAPVDGPLRDLESMTTTMVFPIQEQHQQEEEDDEKEAEAEEGDELATSAEPTIAVQTAADSTASGQADGLKAEDAPSADEEIAAQPAVSYGSMEEGPEHEGVENGVGLTDGAIQAADVDMKNSEVARREQQQEAQQQQKEEEEQVGGGGRGGGEEGSHQGDDLEKEEGQGCEEKEDSYDDDDNNDEEVQKEVQGGATRDDQHDARPLQEEVQQRNDRDEEDEVGGVDEDCV